MEFQLNLGCFMLALGIERKWLLKKKFRQAYFRWAGNPNLAGNTQLQIIPYKVTSLLPISF